MTTTYERPEPLSEKHAVDDFECHSTEQTTWLRRHARHAASTGTTRVLVVSAPESSEVVAYYAWCMAQIAIERAPDRKWHGAGRFPQPVALLARLGVHYAHQGRGLGAGLLQDVFSRLLGLPDDIGCRGLVVHAESPRARDFCLQFVPEFEPSPTDELHLVLLLKDIRRTLRR